MPFFHRVLLSREITCVLTCMVVSSRLLDEKHAAQEASQQSAPDQAPSESEQATVADAPKEAGAAEVPDQATTANAPDQARGKPDMSSFSLLCFDAVHETITHALEIFTLVQQIACATARYVLPIRAIAPGE